MPIGITIAHAWMVLIQRDNEQMHYKNTFYV